MSLQKNKNQILSLEELKQLPAFLPHHSKRESHPFSLLAGGFPKGSVIEVSARNGSGKTELILKLLAENPSIKVAWVERELTLYPYACAAAGLERMLFVEATNRDPLAIAHQLIRSQVFALVVLTEVTCTELALRRLQLATQKSGASAVLLATKPTLERSWPIALQLKVLRERGELRLETIRGRA